jgi:lysophospholipase L1-like esterase
MTLKRRLKSWWQGVIVSGISLLLTLTVLEIGLRLFYPQFGSCQIGMADPVLGVRLIPGFSGTCAGVAHETVAAVQINSLGFRGPEVQIPKPANRYRVLMLGDSTTFGTGVANSETVPAFLEANLNKNVSSSKSYEVINAGVPGYGTAQEWLLYRQHVEQLDPDLVILMFLVTNDIHDNMCAEDGEGKPCFALEHGQLVLKGRDVPASAPPSRAPATPFRLDALHTYVFFRERIRHFVSGNPNVVRFLKERGWQYDTSALSPTLQAWYSADFAPAGWQLTRALLGSLRSDALKDEVPLIMVILPGRPQTIENFALIANLLYRDTAAGQLFLAEPLRPQMMLKAWANENGVPVLDTLDALRKAAISNTINLVDGHFNAVGNQVIARGVLTFMTENNLWD